MTQRCATVRGVWLLQAALLVSAVAVACTSSSKDPSPSTSAGAAGETDTPTATNAAGASGGGTGPQTTGHAGENAAGSAGAGSAGTDNAGGAGESTGAAGGGAGGAGGSGETDPVFSPNPAYASSVESFDAGGGAGFNQDKMPGIVLGPPVGNGTSSGSLDVVSLGAGGDIVLGFGDVGIGDGPGADLVVFENAFWPGGDKTQVFYELSEVSVSEDGETWHTFPCDTAGDGDGNFAGCAGVTPTLVYDADTLVPLDPALSGGDAFDLADLGIKHANFVKIHDLQTLPVGGNTTGFDLDAVVAIHAN